MADSPDQKMALTPPPPRDLPASAVQVTALSLWRGNTPILRELNLRLPQGQCSVLLGPNGSGKSTLTRCLTGQALFASGQIQVLGQTIGQCDIRLLRRRIGLVNPCTDQGAANHQSGSIVDGELSALQAVATGFFATVGLYDVPSDAQWRRAESLLNQVGLSHRLNVPLASLSSGEQRRAIIARALANDPRLLILDEPTAGLDIAGREQVLATVDHILGRSDPPTLLMITHHVEEIPRACVQVMLMKEGRITHQGQPGQIITPELLTQTFGCRVFVRKVHGRWWLEVLPDALENPGSSPADPADRNFQR